MHCTELSCRVTIENYGHIVEASALLWRMDGPSIFPLHPLFLLLSRSFPSSYTLALIYVDQSLLLHLSNSLPPSLSSPSFSLVLFLSHLPLLLSMLIHLSFSISHSNSLPPFLFYPSFSHSLPFSFTLFPTYVDIHVLLHLSSKLDKECSNTTIWNHQIDKTITDA